MKTDFINCLKHDEFILLPSLTLDKYVGFHHNYVCEEKTLTIGWLCWFIRFTWENNLIYYNDKVCEHK